MKKYYVNYYRNFANTYNLYYAETEEQLTNLPQTAERITRKEAERLARAESNRRKFDSSCSGYADEYIYPADYPAYRDIMNDNRYMLDGRVFVKK